MRKSSLFLSICLGTSQLGCSGACSSPADLVIYSGRSAESVEALIANFEEESGLAVDVRYEKTPVLAERMAAEGEQTPADIFFAQDSGYLGALAQAGILQPLPDGIAELVPTGFTGNDDHWVATSGRMRVLVYSPERVQPEHLPNTLFELADGRWEGRLGWAPTNGSFQAHVSALRSFWGEEDTREWLNRMQALSPREYEKNSPQVEAVANGEIDIGWVNHYYLHRALSADPNLEIANHHFPEGGDAGNLMMLSGVAITNAARHPDEAETFIRFLLSESSQSWFTQEGFEYPIVEGTELHPNLPPAMDGRVQIDQTALTDVMGTRTLLDELDIL